MHVMKFCAIATNSFISAITFVFIQQTLSVKSFARSIEFLPDMSFSRIIFHQNNNARLKQDNISLYRQLNLRDGWVTAQEYYCNSNVVASPTPVTTSHERSPYVPFLYRKNYYESLESLRPTPECNSDKVVTRNSNDRIHITPVIISQAHYNLSGQWELETGTFGPECFVSKDIEKFSVTFTQNGNQFTANGGTVFVGRGTSPANIGNGRLSGDRFESQSDIFYWIGTVSGDGNYIQGNVTCQMSGGGTGRGTLPFTMKRSTSVQPIPDPAPPTGSPTEPLW